MAKAREDYTSALASKRKGASCDGLAPIASARTIDAGNQDYLNLQQDLKDGCDRLTQAKEAADRAEVHFQNLEYCEGVPDINKAVELAPQNADYKARQKSMTTGCKLHLQ